MILRPPLGLLVKSALNLRHQRMDGVYLTSTLLPPAESNASFNQEIVAAAHIPHSLPDAIASSSPGKKAIKGKFSCKKGNNAVVSKIQNSLVQERIFSNASRGYRV